MPLTKQEKHQTGIALVVKQLKKLKGFDIYIPQSDLKSIDVIVFKKNLSNVVLCQVKSTDKSQHGWPVYNIPANADNWQKLLKKSVSLGKNFFYIFVELPNKDREAPSFYIVPSKDVANMLIQDITAYIEQHKNLQPANQLLAWGYSGLKPEVRKRYQNKWGMLKGNK